MRLIDADLLTERLNNAIECGRRVDMPTLELEAVLVNVQNAPSIDIEPKRGEWIAKTENYHSHWVCSECGGWALLEYNEQMCLSNFCPNCGADMRGKDDD